MLDNTKFYKLSSTYPDIYDRINANKDLRKNIIFYRINKVLWKFTQHTLFGMVLIFATILIFTAPLGDNFESFMDQHILYVIIIFALYLLSFVLIFYKPKGWDNLRANLKRIYENRYYNAINRNTDTISDAALIHVQNTDLFKNAMDNQANELVQDVTALACYDAIPDNARFYEMISRMKVLSDQGIAIESWSVLAGRARQELHAEAQTQRIVDKLDQMMSRLDDIYDNQLTIIQQNNEITGLLHNIENATLRQARELEKLNRQIGDLNHLAGNISSSMQRSFGTAVGVFVGDVVYDSMRH